MFGFKENKIRKLLKSFRIINESSRKKNGIRKRIFFQSTTFISFFFCTLFMDEELANGTINEFLFFLVFKKNIIQK